MSIRCMCTVLYIVFFKQKTAYEMRISDWSSDVCSSDLPKPPRSAPSSPLGAASRPGSGEPAAPDRHHLRIPGRPAEDLPHVVQIGRASCRERVCKFV